MRRRVLHACSTRCPLFLLVLAFPLNEVQQLMRYGLPVSLMQGRNSRRALISWIEPLGTPSGLKRHGCTSRASCRLNGPAAFRAQIVGWPARALAVHGLSELARDAGTKLIVVSALGRTDTLCNAFNQPAWGAALRLLPCRCSWLETRPASRLGIEGSVRSKSPWESIWERPPSPLCAGYAHSWSRR